MTVEADEVMLNLLDRLGVDQWVFSPFGMKELEHMDPERVREEKRRGTDRRAWWTSSRSPWHRCQWQCGSDGVEVAESRRGGATPVRWCFPPLAVPPSGSD